MVKPEAKLLHPERASQDPRTDMDSPPMKLLKGMCPEVDKSSLVGPFFSLEGVYGEQKERWEDPERTA
jgi:hypothetical protein